MNSDVSNGEFGQAWPLVLASAVGFGLGLSGLPFYTAGVFLDPLTQAFGWTTAQAQSGLLVMLWSVAIMSPAAGVVADRFGARRVALVSIALFGLSFMALGLMSPSLLHYRLAWGLLAVAGAGTLAVIWSRAVSARFVKQRGLALGLVLAGSGVTAILAPPVTVWLIETVGWRLAYVCLGALPLLISLPIVTALFRDVETGGARAVNAPPSLGLDFAQAMRAPRFWLIAICIGAVSAGVAGCIPNLVKILVAEGQTRHAAVWIVSLVGFFIIAGRTVSGYLIDRFWAPAVGFVFLAGPAVGCLLLVYGPPGLPCAVVAAMLVGLAAGAEFDLLAYLIAAYFGLRRYGAIYGVACAVFTMGAGIAPMVFAMVFDRTGSYHSVLLIAAAIFVLAGGGLLLLGRYPRFGVDEVL